MACQDLPELGESVQLLQNPDSNGKLKSASSFKAEYKPGIVTAANDESCRFTVRQEDGRVVEQTADRWLGTYLVGGFYGAYGGMLLWSPGSDKAFDTELEEELKNFDRAIANTPDSGRWRGATVESDGAAQAVETNLVFTADGKVSGSGVDDDDGPYTIVNGQWSHDEKGNPTKATWTEAYKQGPRGAFSVKVRATIVGTNQMDCTFKSSKGITGTFRLAKRKPTPLGSQQ